MRISPLCGERGGEGMMSFQERWVGEDGKLEWGSLWSRGVKCYKKESVWKFGEMERKEREASKGQTGLMWPDSICVV